MSGDFDRASAPPMTGTAVGDDGVTVGETPEEIEEESDEVEDAEEKPTS